MIVRRFLLWARTAGRGPRHGRGHARQCLSRSALSEEDRREAETALIALVDDPSPLVRRAIAEEMASSRPARRAILRSP